MIYKDSKYQIFLRDKFGNMQIVNQTKKFTLQQEIEINQQLRYMPKHK